MKLSQRHRRALSPRNPWMMLPATMWNIQAIKRVPLKMIVEFGMRLLALRLCGGGLAGV